MSALGNVVSLYLRSRAGHKDGEYDYTRIINRQLPNDIRIIACKLVPHHFDARFSCLYREYKYFFVCSADMDIEKIRTACGFFVGVHDFKNFCKEDSGKKKTTERRILACSVEKRGTIGEICVRGYSFLWHQVRCMVAVLFRIGLGVEQPSIIQNLLENLDVKPQYEIASELGLILYDCAFETLKFDQGDDAQENARCLFNVYENLMIKLEVVKTIFGVFEGVEIQSKKKMKRLLN